MKVKLSRYTKHHKVQRVLASGRAHSARYTDTAFTVFALAESGELYSARLSKEDIITMLAKMEAAEPGYRYKEEV